MVPNQPIGEVALAAVTIAVMAYLTYVMIYPTRF